MRMRGVEREIGAIQFVRVEFGKERKWEEVCHKVWNDDDLFVLTEEIF
jgi:hypothetical protein